MKLFHLISIFITTLLTALLLGGCINENEETPDSYIGLETAILVLNVQALNTDVNNMEGGVREKVNSLRIIMIDEKGIIECNEFADKSQLVNNEESLYSFFRLVSPGEKKFYLFANEEEVKNLNTSNSGISNFYNLLSAFKEGEEKGNEFEDLIKSLSFSPDYKVIGDEIALPYTSFYQISLLAGQQTSKTMYLVPAAVKWDIQIHNNRAENVEVKSISIRSISDRMFLMAKLEEEEKKFNGESRYWIDWLKEVSVETNKYPAILENEDINTLYGWITDYKMPEGVDHKEFQVSDGFEIEAPTTPELGQESIPGEKILTTVYLPESRNQSSSNVNNQAYYITIEVNDSQNTTIILNRLLPRVKSQFRNTHVVLDLNFSAAYLHVYGEIVNWQTKEVVKGHLTEEE